MDGALELVTEKLQSWLEALIAMLPNLAVALLVLIFFWILARVARKIVRKGLGRLSITPSLVALSATIASLVIIAIGLFVALGVLNLDKTVTSLLAGAGVLGLVLGFAFQDVASDVLAGMLLAVRKPFVIGDLVETNDAFGTVQEINLRSTVVDTPPGQRVMIPNRNVFTNNLTNFTRLGNRRIDLAVGVSYGEDLAHVKEVAENAIRGIEGRVEDRDIEIFFEEFGDSSINFVARFWIPFQRQAQYLAARSEAVMRVKAAFDDADIMIPFPIRTLDFGIKGGEKLDAMLASRRQLAEQDGTGSDQAAGQATTDSAAADG